MQTQRRLSGGTMGFARFALVLPAVLIVACGGDDEIIDPPDPQLPNGVFAAVVDGAEYAPTVATVNNSENSLTITTSVDGLTFSFTIASPGFGTFLFNASTSHVATWTGPGTLSWQAHQGTGSGSITINTRTSNRVAGSFNLVLGPVAGTGATGNKQVASGIFNLTY